MRWPHDIIAGWTALLLAAACLLAADGGFEWRDGRWVRSAAPAAGGAAGEVAKIRQLVDQGRNSKAVKAAKAFVKKHPESPHCQETMMLAGEGEFARGRYYQAFEWFEMQLARFPSGKYFYRVLDREFKVAEAFLSGKKRIVWGFVRLPAKDEGLEILARIAEHAPNSAIAERAMLRIADYHYEAGNYADAVRAYDEHLAMFKRSPNAAYAMLQAARATRAQFIGIEFDDTPLIEAEERFKAFAERFPRPAREEKVSKILQDIADTLAKKLCSSGDYYARVGKPSAAAFYYKQVVEKYPRTSWARHAGQLLRGLGDVRPLEPAGKFVLSCPEPTTRPTRPAAATVAPSLRSQLPRRGRESRIER